MLQRLIYFSERDRECTDVRELVTQAAARNRRRGITGLLVADGRCFVQVLEGHRNAVSSLFQSISGDRRHRNLVLVDVAEVQETSGTDWGMSKLDDPRKIAAVWEQLQHDRVFDPWSLSANEIKEFIALAAYEIATLRQDRRVSSLAG